MTEILDKYFFTAVLLLTAAATFVATPLIFSQGDFVTSLFVVSGLACAILGSFMVMFSGNEPLDPHLIGLLPVQVCLNLCRIASDSGINGNACFLPSRLTGDSRVLQFNPASEYHGELISAMKSFTEEKPYGLVTVPSADPLIQDLKKRNALVIPEGLEDLSVLMSETICEVFEFAPNVTTFWDRGTVTITIHEYRFFEGCSFFRSKSPQCCTRYPCPVCSLCGTLIAEGINRVVTLDQCSLSSAQDLTMVYTFDGR